MAPITTSSTEENHQALLDKLDTFSIPKPFRNPNWRAAQRRNKTIKQIISEASRREAASMLATPGNNSGSSTPMPGGTTATASDAGTPAGVAFPGPPPGNIAQRLDRLVLERSAAQAALNAKGGAGAGALTPSGMTPGVSGLGPQMSITYTNIESAPSLSIASKKHYCDVTGLLAPYTDPKSRLRYHNKEVFALVRSMGQGSTEGYLAARGAHTVLK